jgi:hypothetical protein
MFKIEDENDYFDKNLIDIVYDIISMQMLYYRIHNNSYVEHCIYNNEINKYSNAERNYMISFIKIVYNDILDVDIEIRKELNEKSHKLIMNNINSNKHNLKYCYSTEFATYRDNLFEIDNKLYDEIITKYLIKHYYCNYATINKWIDNNKKIHNYIKEILPKLFIKREIYNHIVNLNSVNNPSTLLG